MGAVSESPSIVSTESDGRSCPALDKNVRRRFGDVCKVLWPEPQKPDIELAIIGDVDDRTARRWMAGERDEVPWTTVIKAVVDRMFEPIP